MIVHQPYRIFFPIGLLYGMIGTGLWVLHGLRVIAYPGQAHAHIMTAGFLLSFVTGFLLTAAPRFLNTRPADQTEVTIGLVTAALPLASLFQVLPPWTSNVAMLALLTFLVGFMISRFSQRKAKAPPHFVLLGLGLAAGVVGTLLLLFSEQYLLGRSLLYHGTILGIIMGVGGRMIRNLLGWNAVPQRLFALDANLLLGIYSVAFVGSFALEGAGFSVAGKITRALVLTAIALNDWNLHKRPRSKSKFTHWLWVASWALVFGAWIYGAFPSVGIHGAHLMFMSGLGLITLLVATRVTLAHGGYALVLEQRLSAYRWIALLVLLATATRLSAFFFPAVYESHLTYASLTWICALMIWSVSFAMKFNQTPKGAPRVQ